VAACPGDHVDRVAAQRGTLARANEIYRMRFRASSAATAIMCLGL